MLSSVGADDKIVFGAINADAVTTDIHTQPDEQRYRAFLLATSVVLAMKPQLMELQRKVMALKRKGRSLQELVVELTGIVDLAPLNGGQK